MKRYTIGSFGRYIPIAGHSVIVQAESLREAIRIVRKRNFSRAWSLRLKKVEDIPQVRA